MARNRKWQKAGGKEKVEQKNEGRNYEERKWRKKRKTEGGGGLPCSPLTSKSHGNARSPAPTPSNQMHTLSQVCFNTLHAHNHVSNSAVNNWLPCLPLMALLQVDLYSTFFFSFLVLGLFFDEHTFNQNRSLRNMCARRWHAVDELLGHGITRSESNWIECKIVLSLQEMISVNTSTATDVLDHNIMR